MKKLLVLFTILGLGVVGCASVDTRLIEYSLDDSKKGVVAYQRTSLFPESRIRESEDLMKSFCSNGGYVKKSVRFSQWASSDFLGFYKPIEQAEISFECKNQTSEKKPDVEKNSR